jgi:hypothetical protein
MSNEIAQPTEQDLTRTTSKASKPPALDTSGCMFYPIPELAVAYGLVCDAPTIQERFLTSSDN